MALKLSVVFVRFGLPEMEASSLKTLLANTNCRDLSLRVIDNWGNPESLTALWDRVCNEEIRAGKDVICLLNSDCWVAPGWWGPIEKIFEGSNRVAVCGPLSNCGPQTAPGEVPGAVFDAAGPNPGWLANAANRCRELWPGQFSDCEIYGHCYCVHAAHLRAAKCFMPEVSEGFTLYGSEQALSSRLRKMQLRTVVVKDSYAFHLGQASGKKIKNLAEEQERGRELYVKKRGGQSGGVYT